MVDVLFISMPFATAMAPSIGLSLLKAGLQRRGISSRVRYFTIELAEVLGDASYWAIAAQTGRLSVCELAGEWIFNGDLLDDKTGRASYVDEILKQRRARFESPGMPPLTESEIRRILHARSKVPAFIDACLKSVLAENPRIVGFTTVFQQHVASLALARRIKQARPEITILFGGANCEGAMGAETVRQFPFVDAAVSGEGDVIAPELVRRILANESIEGLPGVRTPKSVAGELEAKRFSNAPMVLEMDELPHPDFSDFFEQFAASRFESEWQPSLYFETSRGCWWGEIQHCTFCGLNGAGMRYRSKSSERAEAELRELLARHPDCDIQVTDNILDMKYFRSFVPGLAKESTGAALFYETKSNLKRDQIRMLGRAGIVNIQPGIESLSDSVLKLMRKGVTALQNVQLLKWCKELGVTPHWNLLWGFPGEDPAEYERMAQLLPQLFHLRPPVGGQTIRLDRFSPNYESASELGFANVRPLASYGHVYDGIPEDAVANLAYYFSFDYREPRRVESYTAALARQIRRWKKIHAKTDLFFADQNGILAVWDLRACARRPLTLLSGEDRQLYLACDAVSDARQLASAAAIPIEEVQQRLARLVMERLILQDGNRFLALGIRLGDYVPSPEILGRSEGIARELGSHVEGGVAIALDALAPRGARGRRSTVRNETSHSLGFDPSAFFVDRSHLVIQMSERR